MNIYASICNIMESMGAVAKSKKHQQGYQYRGVDDIMNVLQPQLALHKVVIVPEVMEQLREERQSAKGGLLIYSILKIKFKFYAEDGSNVEAVTIGEAFDSGDKGSNKAMSIAFKYACFQVFCIPTEEMQDPEDDVSADVAPRAYMTEQFYNRILELTKNAGLTEKAILGSVKKQYGKTDFMELTNSEYSGIVNYLNKVISEKENTGGGLI